MKSIKEKIIAHRGESFEALENSLSAIRLAWKKGASAVEIDVHLTADQEIVVIHDPHTGRVGDKKLFVKKSTLQELKRIRLDRKKKKISKEERIPTLHEVLETVPPEGKLIIEIKCGKEIIKPFVKILNSTKLKHHQMEVISFNFEVLSSLKIQLPHYKMLYLLDLDYYWPHWLLAIKPQKIIKKVQDQSLDGVNVWAGKVINPSFVNAFKKEGLLFYVWTVNDIQKAHRLLAYGVDAITTDRAGWMSQQLMEIKP